MWEMRDEEQVYTRYKENNNKVTEAALSLTVIKH
jgi:hypothetical protein